MSSAPRHIATLSLIPIAPRRIATADLLKRLQDLGYNIGMRDIQRDLQKLSFQFPLQCDDRSKPYGWSFIAGHKPLNIPSMDPATALAFMQAKDLLGKALPGSLQKAMEPYYDMAHTALSNTEDPRFSSWSHKVKILPDWQPLATARYSKDILNTVTDALFQQKMLKVRYRPRGQQRAKESTLNPQGLIIKSRVIYLIAGIYQYPEIYQYALHRIQMAEMLTEDTADIGFSLDDYVSSGEANYLLEARPVRIRLRFEKYTGEHLLETPFSDDMQVKETGAYYEMSGTVPLSQQLVWWLLGFGANVEVLAPAKLRKLIMAQVDNLSAIYGKK